MNKQKLSITLMLIALALPLLKIAHLPGTGVILTIGLSTISMLFALLAPKFRYSQVLKFKWEDTEEAEENNQVIGSEMALFLGLSILCIGILFTAQHWPGGTIQKTIGGLATLIAALCNIFLLNEEKCSYYSKIRSVSLVAIFFAIVGMTNYYTDFIFKKQISDYHHLVEIYNKQDGSEEQRKEQNVEFLKFYDFDSEKYNHFDSLLTKANAMAEADGNARVLYLIMDQISRYGMVLNGVVYDKEEEREAMEINLFAARHSEIFKNDTKLIVVTDDAEAATEKLKALSSENKEIIIVE